MLEAKLIEKTNIHSSAVIHPKAKIGNGVSIGPFVSIGENVEIGDSTYIGPHVVIEGKVKIGNNCNFTGSCFIGAPPQDLGYKGEDTGVIIGDKTLIREYVTIHRASKEGSTIIGNECFLMNYVHLAHNVILGNNVIMANTAMLPGYVTVGDYVFISGFSTVHQHCRIGESSIVGAMTGSRLDLPPYFIADGRPAQIRGVNKVGLRRRKFSRELINEIDKAYKTIYRSNLNLTEALQKIESELHQYDEIKKLVEFYKSTKRGVVLTSSGEADYKIETT